MVHLLDFGSNSGASNIEWIEAFLELLWRGLRRVAPGAALSSLASAHPVLS